jgi:uncharacterized membrane protein
MKSIFGLQENIAAALSYVFGFFSGIAVLIMERENKFVRFHALQSTLWFLFLMIVGWVLRLVRGLPFIGWILGIIINPLLTVLGIVITASIIFLAYKAYKGESFKLPIIGDIVWAQINK